VSAVSGLERRHLLGLLGAAAGALLGSRRAGAAATAVQARSVSGFDRIEWTGAGELSIEQGAREHCHVEAEPAVLARLFTEVRRGVLVIGFTPGQLVTREPIRIRVELKALAALALEGAGSVRIGLLRTPALALRCSGSHDVRLAQLDAREFEVRLEGSGGVAVEAGRVEQQRVAISGSARYDADRLASRAARVVIEGSGNAEIAVAERLEVELSGSGNVVYRGEPRVVQSVNGSGRVRRAPA
jgi:Putative auto-transporter adhesin, head GIN domain